MEDSLLKSMRKRQAVILAILTFVSIVMLLLSTRSLTGLPERVGMSVGGFFQGIGRSMGKFASGTINSISELKNLRKDYEEAQKALERYENLERNYADIRQENNVLKEQLGFSTQSAHRRIAAEIIAKDPGNVYSTLVINQGLKDGVRKNLAVIAYQDGIQGLVGRVTEVGRSSSIVLPVHDHASFVAARMDESRYEGLVEGQGGADKPLVMRYVNKASVDAIKTGDLVITSGMNEVFPKDIAIGRIKKRLDHGYKTSLEYELDPVLDFSRLEYVFVVQEIFVAEELPR